MSLATRDGARRDWHTRECPGLSGGECDCDPVHEFDVAVVDGFEVTWIERPTRGPRGRSPLGYWDGDVWKPHKNGWGHVRFGDGDVWIPADRREAEDNPRQIIAYARPHYEPGRTIQRVHV